MSSEHLKIEKLDQLDIFSKLCISQDFSIVTNNLTSVENCACGQKDKPF